MEDEPRLLPNFRKKPSAALTIQSKLNSSRSSSTQASLLNLDDPMDEVSHIAPEHTQTAVRRAPHRVQPDLSIPRTQTKTTTTLKKGRACDVCRQKHQTCDALSGEWNGQACGKCRRSGVSCTFNGEMPPKKRPFQEEISDEEPVFKSPLPAVRLAELHSKNLEAEESSRPKHQPHARPKIHVQMFDSSELDRSRALRARREAEEVLDRMENDRNILEPTRIKQRNLVQRLNEVLADEHSILEERSIPRSRLDSRPNSKSNRSSNDVGSSVLGTSRATISTAQSNYERNHQDLLDMINLPNTNHEDIAIQTEIVRKLRNIVATQSSSSTMNLIDLTSRTNRRIANSIARSSSGSDDEPVLRARRKNKSGEEEARNAVPAALPTQLPKDQRTNKTLGVKDVAKIATVHPTFDEQRTRRVDRHTRTVNTTNRSKINDRKVPPTRSLKSRLTMPTAELSKDNLKRISAVEDDDEPDSDWEF